LTSAKHRWIIIDASELGILQTELAYVQAEVIDWNDLRLLLAVARARGLTGAAQPLGIDHSTGYRRLQAIEARLGVAMFERLPGGVYMPTEAGARAVAAAERIEAEVLGLARDIAGRDTRLAGRLRVTSSETLAYRLLTRHIAAFRRAHPGVVIELVVDNQVLSLSRREADVALRPLRPRESDLWGRKLAEVASGAYGARALLERMGRLSSVEALQAWPMIGWEDGAVGIGAADWLSGVVPDASFVFRTTSLVNQLVAARAGIGLAVLPCYLADPEPDLVRALPTPLADLRSEMWIVTHQDLRKTARVRAFFDVVSGGISADRALIEGAAAR
jgi:DNA-binding transcriptional LysR family regulator